VTSAALPARPVPPDVQAAWDRLHAELQRRLEALHARDVPFKLWIEISGERGAPKLIEWAEHDRQQPAAPARSRTS
jgi:hypothetical protein